MTVSETVVITGGCGFVGLNAIRALLAQPTISTIRIVDNMTNADRSGLQGVLNTAGRIASSRPDMWSVEFADRTCYVELVVADIRDFETALKTTKEAQAIVLLAAQTGVQQSLERPRDDVDQNIVGTVNYLEAARLNGVARVIVASSLGVVGDSAPPQTEESLVRPLSPYTAGKAAIEAYCSAYRNSYGLCATALRFANVYGPFAWRKGSVVAAFLKRAFARGSLVVDGDGEQSRDFVYAADLARVIVAAVLGAVGADLWGNPLNVATGMQTKISALASAIQHELAQRGINVRIEHGPARQADVRLSSPSIARLTSILPEVRMRPLSEGLPETIDWFLASRDGANPDKPGKRYADDSKPKTVFP